jgi:hypothetical protein
LPAADIGAAIFAGALFGTLERLVRASSIIGVTTITV